MSSHQKLSNSVTSASKQQVEGAFGFKLGEPLPRSFEVTTNDAGSREYCDHSFTNAPPFDMLVVEVLNDQRIFEIWLAADYSNGLHDQQMQARGIVDTLEEKYGLLSKHRSEDYASWEFGGQDKRVTLTAGQKSHMLRLDYMDYTLLHQAIDDEKVNRKLAARHF